MRPSMNTDEPFVRIFARASPRLPHTITLCQSVRSRRTLSLSRNDSVVAIRMLSTAWPPCVKRSSGSAPRFPSSIARFNPSAMSSSGERGARSERLFPRASRCVKAPRSDRSSGRISDEDRAARGRRAGVREQEGGALAVHAADLREAGGEIALPGERVRGLLHALVEARDGDEGVDREQDAAQRAEVGAERGAEALAGRGSRSRDRSRRARGACRGNARGSAPRRGSSRPGAG